MTHLGGSRVAASAGGRTEPRQDLPILLIARAYPPTTGGMERFARELVENIGARVPVVTLVNRRSKKYLPVFLPFALASGLRLAMSGRVQAVHLCDALLSPIGAAVKAVSGLPVSVSAHGLDITYRNALYQAALRASLPRLDLVVAGSRPTRDLVLKRFPSLAGRVRVVNYGVAEPGWDVRPDQDVEAMIRGRKVVLTVGRLVERKGVAWFTSAVLPRLARDSVYVAVGEGPDRARIVEAARHAGVENRLILVGRLPDAEVRWLYRRADVFVMPNITVPGDVEGFGLVALEAAVQGLPVVASRVDGIPDAVTDGGNGRLVEARDAGAFASAVNELLAMPAAARDALGDSGRRFTLDRYSWSRMADEYLRLLAPAAGLSVAAEAVA